jgi:CCR4-NOT transcription complex subunit 1
MFSPELEKEALTHYEKLYKGELTIAQVIDLLKLLKASKIPREQEMFKCMVQYLFDEYRYFARYPERQLLVTGVLFGNLIQNQVVTSMALGIALRYVLEALRQPPISLIFKFGIHALAQFQSRLSEWPQYCSLLIQIEHLHQSTPEIIHYIKTMPIPPPTDALPNSEPEPGTQIFTALNLASILRSVNIESYEEPNEQTQDKILFIINNLAFSNLESKVKEIIELFDPKFARWFSHYIVVKRASIEPNFHSLYVAFIGALNMPQVETIILYETLSEIRDLLNSEKTVNSSQERSLLKNLGTWLGSITLAKNIPIKHSSLAFKELLLQGYDNKRLIVVIPFVCKVLEQCTSSKVFKPPNPWLVAIMKLLAELYHYAELKLNLKFEVEVLCKNIKLDIKDFQPSELLRMRQTNEERYPPAMISNGNSGVPEFSPEEDGVGYANLANFITFNPNISIFNTRPALKRIVQIAIDRSIREVILSPVVERSVTIAVIATRELTIKDFALEPNEDKMRKAAQSMVQSLSGSLASVSSREPLRISMISNMKNLLLQNGFTEQTVPEQVVYVIVSDNLDLACSFMEKAAAEKSVQEIDESLAVAYSNRKKHREKSTQPYYDLSVYAASRYPSALPDQLRLRPGGLTAQQMMVYEDFTRVQHPLNDGSEKILMRETEPSQAVYGETSSTLTNIKILDKFATIISEIDSSVVKNPNSSLAALSAQPDLQNNMQQILWLTSKAPQLEEATLIISQKLFQLLFTNQSNSSNEVYIWLLIKLIEISPKLLRDIKEWLLYQDDERKFVVSVTVALIKAELLNVHELDCQLARLMDMGKYYVVSFALSLLRTCILDEAFCFYTDFIHSIECLNYSIGKGKAIDGTVSLLEDIKKTMSIYKIKELMSTEYNHTAMKDQLDCLFREWLKTCCHPGSSEKTQVSFVTQIISSGLLKNVEYIQLFIRTTCEICIESFGQNGPPSASYSPIDSLARLLVLLVVYYTDASVADKSAPRLSFMSNVFSVIALVICHFHEKHQLQFNQKPFFRLYSSILNEMSTHEAAISPIYTPSLAIMGFMFLMLGIHCC